MKKQFGMTGWQWSIALIVTSGGMGLLYAFVRDDIPMVFISIIFFGLAAGSAFRAIKDEDEE